MHQAPLSMGILQAILEGVAMYSSRGSYQPRDRTQVSHIAGGFFTDWDTRQAQEHCSRQSVPSPGDCPDPGIKPGSPAMQADSLLARLPQKHLPPIEQPKDQDAPLKSSESLKNFHISWTNWLPTFSLHLPLWPELDKNLLQSKEQDNGREEVTG